MGGSRTHLERRSICALIGLLAQLRTAAVPLPRSTHRQGLKASPLTASICPGHISKRASRLPGRLAASAAGSQAAGHYEMYRGHHGFRSDIH